MSLFLHSPNNRIFRWTQLISTIIVVVLISTVAVDGFAQEDSPQPTKDQRRAELQQQLNELQKQIDEYQAQIDKYRGEKLSASRQINILENEAGKIRAQMRENELILSQTEISIETNQLTIKDLEEKSAYQKEILAELVRDVYRTTSTSPLEIILQYTSLSGFFDNVQQQEVLNESLQITLSQIEDLQDAIAEEQLALEQKREGQVKILQVQDIQRSSLAQKVNEKEVVVAQNRNKENEFLELAQETQKTIGEIRSQLFVLEGAGVATSFGQAYQHAKYASQLTGVRPAFLLAVLKRESSWGANVGQCYLVDPATGTGKGMNTGTIYERVMKPTRDVQPFMQITAELGRDPFATPVSCPHPQYGYGGAMGPAQFIPSTWIGYRDRAAAVLGHAPDPWNISDAFVTSAIKLAAAGASSQNPDHEWKAAMIYYAGGNWSNPTYWPYANWIMDKAAEYQADIDILEG